jgi:hypothetical protein
MLKSVNKPFLYACVWGMSFLVSSVHADNTVYGGNQNQTYGNPSGGSKQAQGRMRDQYGRPVRTNASGREEIAYVDRNDDQRPRDDAFRMGDWDYHQDWKYHQRGYFTGETQPEYYRETHPYGQGGIGYDADDDDLRYQRNANSHASRGYSNGDADGSISYRGDKNPEDYPSRSATRNREGSRSSNR